MRRRGRRRNTIPTSYIQELEEMRLQELRSKFNNGRPMGKHIFEVVVPKIDMTITLAEASRRVREMQTTQYFDGGQSEGRERAFRRMDREHRYFLERMRQKKNIEKVL